MHRLTSKRAGFVRSRSARGFITIALAAGVLAALPAVASAAPTGPPPSSSSSSAEAGPAPDATTAPGPPATKTVITPGLKGWDSLSVENASQIGCLAAHDYSYDVVNTNGDSWQDEYNAAAAAGLKVVLFQGYDSSTWGTVSAGGERAKISAEKAAAAGYPKGAMIFLNLEDTGGSKVLLKWVQGWIAAIRNGGYLAGIYVGIDPGLDQAQLDSLGGVSGFWKGASTSGVPVVARGYLMRQPPPLDVPSCNTQIDNDDAAADRNGAQVIGAAFPKVRTAPTAPGTFNPLSPTRLLDTRTGVGAPKGEVKGGGHVDLQVTGPLVPNGASAVVLNVTVTAPVTGGNVAVAPTGTEPMKSPVSNVNFAPGQTIPNLVTVELSTAGKVTLTLNSPGSAQIIADVAGYYLGGTGTAPGTFTPVTPTRLLDTRPHPVASGSTTHVQITGRMTGVGTPSPVTIPPTGTVSSAVLNVTAVLPMAAGYLKAFSGDGGAPNASILNFRAGQTVPNLAVVPVSTTTGQIALVNGSNSTPSNSGRTDLLADVAGFFQAGVPTSTGAFASITPVRILDTRSSASTRVPANSAIALQVAGKAGVPATATAVAINVTVTNPAGVGYLSVFPSDRSAPLASNLNFSKGQTVANLVMVPIGADGKIVLNNQSNGTTDLVGDVAGYFVG